MKIDVITYDKTKRYSEIENTIILIDVLRCTSAMIHALENGAERIIPMLDPKEAIALAKKLGRENCVVGGERACIKQPGFDVGNSPFEYGAEVVKGKTVIISTSNGTNAICGFAGAKTAFIGAMSNRSAIAKAASGAGKDILIVCSGTDGRTSADDLCAAGAIIDAIEGEAELTDAAMISLHLYNSLRDGSFPLQNTRHYARLISLGFEKDVQYCFTEDSTSIVPRYIDGVIRI